MLQNVLGNSTKPNDWIITATSIASSKGEIQTDEKNRHTRLYNNYKYCKELNVSLLKN